MTRDVAAQAVHERLESLTATMPEPDIEAGWAALVAQLEPPVAPVVPLRRRPRPRRAIILGVAAAILIGGSALAMVRHGANDGQQAVHPPAVARGHLVQGPHTHPRFSGPRWANHGRSPGSTDGHHRGTTGPTGGSTSSNDGSGGPTSGSSDANGGTHSFHHDSPNDTDHGTGNDVHGDNGHGNNTQGNNAQGQDTQSDGSTGGSGGDQGSGGGQGSGNRGTHATGGGEHAGGGDGTDGGHGSNGQGQGGGQGRGSHG